MSSTVENLEVSSRKKFSKMMINFKNSVYWHDRKRFQVLLIFVFVSILLIVYFVRNPTSMTYNKIRLKKSCLLHKNNLDLQNFAKLKEKIFDLERQECVIVYPIIEQIFEFEVSSRSLVVNKKFESTVSEWFQNNNTLVKRFKTQRYVQFIRPVS